ncbi:MAG: hypothetical protein ACKOQ1_00115 [Actinomycetota bacterium]
MSPAPVDAAPASALLAAVRSAYPEWLRSRITAIARASGRDLDPVTVGETDRAITRATAWVETELQNLLATDVDAQRANPLQVLRRASRFAADVLESAGVPVPVRDEFEHRAMPEDPYGVGPLAWRDLGEEVHETGIEWGAWKAATVLMRRREEGRR